MGEKEIKNGVRFLTGETSLNKTLVAKAVCIDHVIPVKSLTSIWPPFPHLKNRCLDLMTPFPVPFSFRHSMVLRSPLPQDASTLLGGL